MADDLELDLDDLDKDINNRNKVEERIKDLSSKVKLTSQERDELQASNKKLEDEKAAALKEKDFYASFSDTVSQYPNAKDFKDKIKEKVMAGYSVEDATVAVLAKEGKLATTPSENIQPEPKQSPAGGSATTSPPTQGQKPISEMTREEKRQALLEAEARGDVGIS